MSNEQPPVRDVVPYKPGKRVSTFRRLKIDFAGTALEQALAQRDQSSSVASNISDINGGSADILNSSEVEDDRLSQPSESFQLPESSLEKAKNQITPASNHSPPVTTTPQLTRENPQVLTTHKPLLSAQEGLSTSHHQSPPVTTTPPYEQSQLISSTALHAPTKDFNRRANSLERDALPSGVFPGSSKKVYDALYLRTRGAIVPKRMIQASRRDLLEWTGIRNLKTIDNHIRYLMAVGLIVRHWELGSNEGSSYEVVLPEERESNHSPPLPTTGEESPPDTTSQKTGSGYTQKLGSGGEGQTIENAATYRNHNTINTIDDDTHTETLEGFIRIIVEASRSVVGGEFNDTEQERLRWQDLGQLLADELKYAAQRTIGISSVPAFLTTHLRRRLAQRSEKSDISEGTNRERSIRLSSVSSVNSMSSESHGTARPITPVTSAKNEKGHSDTNEGISKGAIHENVKSRYTLEECRRYALHLQKTGQGITNPGGYATTIHRTGEADDLIEKFLTPTPAPTIIDASKCPDCQGTGWWYPKGKDMGAARCKHEQLRTDSG